MFRYLISIFFYLLACITFIITGIPFVILSLLHINIMYALIPCFCRILLLSLGVIIKIDGSFPRGGPFVIMFNHCSFIDPFVYGSIIEGKFTGVVAAKNFKIPLFGLILKNIKAIPIHRNNRKKAIESIKYAEKVIKQGHFHMAILPEGTRTTDGKLQKFKKGGFHMAINTHTPILPIVAIGAFEYKPKTRFTIKPGIVKLKIGEPIQVNGGNSDINELMQLTESKFHELFESMQ